MVKVSQEAYEIIAGIMTSPYITSQTLLCHLTVCKHCREVFDSKGIRLEDDLQCPKDCLKV